MRKKGQAAVEFLMTYGWAILAAVIAIGVLAYFGVFSPGKYVTDSTVVTAPLYATGQRINATVAQIELQNNGGEDLNITRVFIDSTNAALSDCTWTGSQTLTPSQRVAFAATCASSLQVGASYKGDVTIDYVKTGSTITLTSTGTVAAKVVA